ncbi:hypothetical protein A2755_01480 [Candidatus Wolfebacteria bacterium RIFCSPHIGHO2_01_FULL_48_22]|uniref:Uncharacterized protein n=2 Tax=Candidatus Wolfeibacteriota TaxID=1752735 RepID=A0A1F8DV82_9BACT|nr:MAG: hypothetical protein A2755_01480 [Candidatus Wolfebacteria bacterium RIFCSPHIGHO2_01_FULL_48_22]OGM93885.1 MAG: hypothetical protein A2935_03305 [Candidatus Wolfebacteria bacterium RIFCSPLOWO2_01_FULL_47_17b]
MYSPQQQTQSYTKPAPRQAGFPWRLLLLTGVVLGMMVLVYGGITFGYRPYIESQLAQMDAQLDAVSLSLQADEEDVFDVYSQLYNIQMLSSKHIYGSKIFSVLEAGTNPSVQLTKAEADVAKNILLLEGVAADHDIVVSQAATYRIVAGVSDAQLTSSVRGEDGRAHFTMSLIMDKGYFTKP